nr:Cna B-type domain-containing protein [Bacillus mycoides]
MPIIANAATPVNGDKYITKIELKKGDSKVNNGDTLKINERLDLFYEFSLDPNDQYKNGDTVVFSIPKEFQVVSNFSFDMNSPTGEKVATAKIVGDKTSGYQVQMTFVTDYIEKNSLFSGMMDLKCVLNETYVQKGENTIKLPTDSITINFDTSSSGGGGGWDGINGGNSSANGKTGKIRNTSVSDPPKSPGDFMLWNVDLGRDTILGMAGVDSFDKIESIYVADAPKNQRLVVMSDLYNGWEGFAYFEGHYTTMHFEDGKISQDEMGVSSDLKSFNMDVLPRIKAMEDKAIAKNSVFKQFTLQYYTRPENNVLAGTQLENKATISIKVKGSDVPKTWTISNSVTWNEGSGSIVGKVAGVRINKMDSQDSRPLKDAHFDLYRQNNDGTSTKISDLVTNDAGVAQYPNDNKPGLPIGNYYLEETAAPSGYLLDKKKHNFSISDKDIAKTTDKEMFYLDETIQNSKATIVEGTKTWKDGDGAGRPEKIKVDLSQNGTVIQTQEVTAANNWKYAFKDLAANDANGVAYKYEVKEQSVAGYKSEVKGYDITNTKEAKTTVEGTKTWNDNNAKDRPSTIKVDLLQNGKVVDTKEVTAATDWKYAFKDLAANDENGKAYKYEVKEEPVAGYETKVNGYDITNTKAGKTSVSGTKTWNDNNASDRPESIKVKLLQNGKEIDTRDASKATDWKYEFKDLAAFDEKGVAYKYEVKEEPVAGYETKVNGYDITNTKVAKLTVEGTKTWNDNNAKDRPSTIKVDLLQNGKVVDTKEVTVATNWKYTFEKLQAYDANGVAYKYEVKEEPVAGYETKVNGYDITNTKVAKLTVEGTKTWNDNNAKDRPSTIKVDLLQNGKVVDTKEVTAATNWKYTFEKLQAYDANGVAYKYEVKEQPVAGYETKVNGYDITNTKVGETKVSGTKTWNDNNASDRPESIKVKLLQNGKEIDTRDASKATDWKYEFKDLAANDENGKAYKYEVKEEPVAGYETKVNGYDITNTKVGETKVSGTKTWNDDNAKDRPGTIKVDLLQNGKVVDTKEVTAATNWKYTFEKLQAYDANGVAYKYEVKEQPVAGYETKVNGYDITNTKVGETKVSGTKTWNDDNAKDRPGTIKVDLLQNGKVVDTKEVTAATNWKYTFEKLQAYDANGVAYKYEVKEQPVAGYEAKVKGYDITNTKVGETKVEGTKTWNDNNAKGRPSTIKVDLLQNGKVVDTKEVTAATNWKYTFEKLQAYDANGVAYKYEVKEQPVAGYEAKVKGYDITNTKVGETKVEGTKTWNDNNAKDRPSTIKVDLLQNGKVVGTKEVTAATNWKYTFEKLQAYDANGVAYKYEVKEEPVAGYETKVNGYDITNTKVGETKVEGTKTWNDNNAKDRPKTIKVDLLQNGQVIATQEVSEVSEWKYAFKDLAAYDANGVAYKYEVKEQPVAGYKSKVNGYDITNTKIKDETPVDPKNPANPVDPKDPVNSVDPKDPVNPKDDTKVPSTKDNQEKSSWLPNTGGTATEMIPIAGGMILLVLGGILFSRRKVK